MSVADYVRTVQTESDLGVPETTHYPALKALLNWAGDELKTKVQAVIHPGRTKVGVPDGELWTARRMPKPGQPKLSGTDEGSKLADRGGIEVKGLDEELEPLLKTEQILKYLTRYRHLLLTNLREFAVVQFRDNKPAIIEAYELAPTKAAFLALGPGDLKKHEKPLQEFLRRALSAEVTLQDPEQVAFFLASHAREARARLDLYEDILQLTGLKEALESSLGIEFSGKKGDDFFRAELVQTLFYGLFSAWVLWHEEGQSSDEKFDYRFTASHLKVPFIDKLYNATASRKLLLQTDLVRCLRNASDVLNRVDRAKFFRAFDTGEAVPYFYEPFLANETVQTLREDRDPYPNAMTTANWTCVGICAHESALRGRQVVALPEFTLI